MTPGIYTVAASAYHADDLGIDAPMLSASIASILLRQSPKHAYAAHPKLGNAPRESSDAFDLGTAAHALMLEGSEDCFVVVNANDWRTNAAKDSRDLARQVGKIPLLTKQLGEVRDMAAAVRQQLESFGEDPKPLTHGHAEQTMIWNDSGVWCKARIDWLHDEWTTIDDLKTGAVSAKPDAWTKTIYGRGGDLQAAFYLRGLMHFRKLTGLSSEPRFRWIVAENTAPFATSVVSLSSEGLAYAHEQVEQAIQTWKRCLDTDEWPGYPQRTCYIDPPAWALAQMMERA
jgi:hypothetical protein